MFEKVMIAFLGMALFAGAIRADDGAAQEATAFKSIVLPFFQAHCVKCHGPEKSKGAIVLLKLGDRLNGHDVKTWERVLDVLRNGEMPPEDEPQPKDVDRQAVAKWIEAAMRRYVAQVGERAESATRRLTNAEYQNTLRDLLGFELKVIDSLPRDPVKPYRFNNTAEFMRIGPEQIDRYLEIARRAMASAIVDPERPEVHKTRREWNSLGNDSGLGLDEIGVWGNRRFSAAGGVTLKSFPRTGEFRVRFQASAILPRGAVEVPLRLVMGYALDVNSATLRIEPIGTARLRSTPDEPKVFEFRGRIENIPPQPGRVVRGQRQPDSMTITPQNLYDDGTLNDSVDFSRTRNITLPRAVLNWIEFEGPLTDVWPPGHHTRILFDSPLRESNPEAYVSQVLRRFMSRAYRRPATDDEVGRFAKIYALLRPELPTLEAAMRETLAMVLISPQFLYHTESNVHRTEANVAAVGRRRETSVSPHALANVATNATTNATPDQYGLASKLSYFLWASMPDDELLRLANEGKLDDPAEIERQVVRLLADERSRGFVENFTMQWLSLQKMKTVPINRELFPRFLYYVAYGERAGTEEPYRPTVREQMIEETIGFVGELIKRNASVMNIVDSDFACLNQRLAAHYGVDGVQGDELRPVPVKPEHHLGGLLTHGSVLIGNGTGTAPHPIYRAVWLREAILGDDVPAPPAQVPALADSAGESAEKALSIAELLARHRTVATCNDCHVRLDPWGIPFERYNAIGRFQPLVPKAGTRVSGLNKKTHGDLAGYEAYLGSINTVQVQASARVPLGPEVDGMRELKDYLLAKRSDDIAKNVIRRLLTYSIGRELTYRDRFAVEELMKQAKKNEFKLRDMIVSVCQSNAFRQ